MTNNRIRQAFNVLMGANGDDYSDYAQENRVITAQQYEEICENVSYNGEESVIEHFGVIHWLYLQGQRILVAQEKLNGL